MSLDPEALLARIVEATERVQLVASAIALSSDRGRYVGVGASGDRTLYADKAAEDELIRALLPIGNVKVLSEEAGPKGDRMAPTTAILDPLDGSSNYGRGLPFYCTSVALATGAGLDGVFLGVVRNLVNGDVYAARRGKGATKNGRRIAPSRVKDPGESVVDVDLSGGSSTLVRSLVPLLSGVKRQVHQGANALELCLLAEGKIDGFVDLREKMRVTDFAAGYLIASEAGCVMTGGQGEELRVRFDLKDRFSYVAAGSRELHRGLLALCGEGTHVPRRPRSR